MKWKKTIVTGVFSNAKASLNASGCITATSVCITMWPNKVSLLGVDSLWGDCTFIPADWGS